MGAWANELYDLSGILIIISYSSLHHYYHYVLHLLVHNVQRLLPFPPIVTTP